MDPVNILILGAVGVGKSTLVNHICKIYDLGENAYVDPKASHTMTSISLTRNIYSYEIKTSDGKLIHVWDTPGIFGPPRSQDFEPSVNLINTLIMVGTIDHILFCVKAYEKGVAQIDKEALKLLESLPELKSCTTIVITHSDTVESETMVGFVKELDNEYGYPCVVPGIDIHLVNEFPGQIEVLEQKIDEICEMVADMPDSEKFIETITIAHASINECCKKVYKSPSDTEIAFKSTFEQLQAHHLDCEMVVKKNVVLPMITQLQSDMQKMRLHTKAMTSPYLNKIGFTIPIAMCGLGCFIGGLSWAFVSILFGTTLMCILECTSFHYNINIYKEADERKHIILYKSLFPTTNKNPVDSVIFYKSGRKFFEGIICKGIFQSGTFYWHNGTVLHTLEK